MIASHPSPLPTRFDSLSWIVALALGATVGIAIPALTGVREAWDHVSYFIVGLPIVTVFAGVAGWSAPRRAWLVAPALALGSLIAMLVTASSSWNLWPLGIAIMLALHSPALLFALGGRALRRRRNARPAP